MSNHIDSEKLEQKNHMLKEAGIHLRKNRDGFQLRHDKQLSRWRFFEQALASSQEWLSSVLPWSPFVVCKIDASPHGGSGGYHFRGVSHRLMTRLLLYASNVGVRGE